MHITKKIFITPEDIFFALFVNPFRFYSVNWEAGMQRGMGLATTGAQLGMMAGPMGAVAGGVIGGIGGLVSGLFSKKAKKPPPPAFISGRFTDDLLKKANDIETRERNLALERFAETDPERLGLYRAAPERTKQLLEQSAEYDPMVQSIGRGYYDLLRNGNAFTEVGGVDSRDQGTSSLLAQQFKRAEEDAALRGALSPGQRSEIARASMTGGALTGLRGKALGDISARDLGLSSMNIDTARQARAGQLGGLQQSIMQDQRDYGTSIDQYNKALEQWNIGQRKAQLGEYKSGLGMLEGLRSGYANMANQEAARIDPYSTQFYGGAEDLSNWHQEQMRNQAHQYGQYNINVKDYESDVKRKQEKNASFANMGNMFGSFMGGAGGQAITGGISSLFGGLGGGLNTDMPTTQNAASGGYNQSQAPNNFLYGGSPTYNMAGGTPGIVGIR